MINESVREVLNIISVIDGIAFQTHILALNAAMKEIVRAGNRVTTIKPETGAASIEQKPGTEHVPQMGNMPQQNAALLEQATASAKSLERQSPNLSVTVGHFKIEDNSSSILAVSRGQFN